MENMKMSEAGTGAGLRERFEKWRDAEYGQALTIGGSYDLALWEAWQAASETDGKLLKLAKDVTSFDWSGNDEDAVRTVDRLRGYVENGRAESQASRERAAPESELQAIVAATPHGGNACCPTDGELLSAVSAAYRVGVKHAHVVSSEWRERAAPILQKAVEAFLDTGAIVAGPKPRLWATSENNLKRLRDALEESQCTNG